MKDLTVANDHTGARRLLYSGHDAKLGTNLDGPGPFCSLIVSAFGDYEFKFRTALFAVGENEAISLNQTIGIPIRLTGFSIV